MEESQAQLIAEQLGRMRDSIFSRLDKIERELTHHNELEAEKILSIRKDILNLEVTTRDHETRLRTNTDGVTQFKVVSGLGSGIGFFSGIGAIIRSFFP